MGASPVHLPQRPGEPLRHRVGTNAPIHRPAAVRTRMVCQQREGASSPPPSSGQATIAPCAEQPTAAPLSLSMVRGRRRAMPLRRRRRLRDERGGDSSRGRDGVPAPAGWPAGPGSALRRSGCCARPARPQQVADDLGGSRQSVANWARQADLDESLRDDGLTTVGSGSLWRLPPRSPASPRAPSAWW